MTAEAFAQLEHARTANPDLAAQYLELLRANPRALYRDGGPTHLTASAFVIDAPREHVALVWHRKGRFWVQPGGHLEAGERDLEAAARREVAEEIGLEDLERVGPGPALLHQHDLSSAFGSCAAHWDVRYLLATRAPAADIPLRASEESPQVRWVPLRRGELPSGTVPDLAESLDQLALYSPTSS